MAASRCMSASTSTAGATIPTPPATRPRARCTPTSRAPWCASRSPRPTWTRRWRRRTSWPAGSSASLGSSAYLAATGGPGCPALRAGKGAGGLKPDDPRGAAFAAGQIAIGSLRGAARHDRHGAGRAPTSRRWATGRCRWPTSSRARPIPTTPSTRSTDAQAERLPSLQFGRPPGRAIRIARPPSPSSRARRQRSQWARGQLRRRRRPADLPGGGLRSRRAAAQAAVRECGEEVGLSIAVDAEIARADHYFTNEDDSRGQHPRVCSSRRAWRQRRPQLRIEDDHRARMDGRTGEFLLALDRESHVWAVMAWLRLRGRA